MPTASASLAASMRRSREAAGAHLWGAIVKTHILRAPETDRKKVLVPNLLTDLDDYADSVSTGKASTDTDAVITPGGGHLVIGLTDTSDLRNMVVSGDGLAPGVDGLFFVNFSVLWFSPFGGPYAGTAAPPPASRLVELYVNGAFYASAAASGVTDGNDVGSTILRLAAGDTVELYAANNGGAGTGTYTHAEITLAKVAP